MERFYINKDTASVTQTDKYLVRVTKKDGTVFEDLEPRRLFPLSNKEMYIALLDNAEHEVAFVRELAQLDEASAAAIRACFAEHYRIPQITAVLSVEDRFGTLTFFVRTEWGETRFSIRNRQSDIKSTRQGHVLIRDADDNRYEITDWHRLDLRSKRLLFSYL